MSLTLAARLATGKPSRRARKVGSNFTVVNVHAVNRSRDCFDEVSEAHDRSHQNQ
jgi:hypothetical protein